MTTADTFPPITYDFTPEIEAIARAGYDAYFQGRPARSWESLHGHHTFRWKLTAQITADGRSHHPSALRNVYLTFYDHVPWSGTSKDDRARWEAVTLAMARARDAVMAERVAA